MFYEWFCNVPLSIIRQDSSSAPHMLQTGRTVAVIRGMFAVQSEHRKSNQIMTQSLDMLIHTYFWLPKLPKFSPFLPSAI